MQPDPLDPRPNGWTLADQHAQAQGHDLHPDHDPAQVQGELHAYLIQRGRQVAQDLRLPQATDQELAQLGRLDCIDQHPTLDPALAQYLELIAHNLERPGPAPEAGQPPRPTETGLDFRAPLTGARSITTAAASRGTADRNATIERIGTWLRPSPWKA